MFERGGIRCAFLALFYTRLAEGLISYSVHIEPSDWLSASKACSLATPEIDFKNGEHLTLSLNKTGLQLQTGEQYHLGYQLLDQTFQHLGCSEVPSDMTINHIVVKPDLGLCFSACSWTNSQYFGLRLISSNMVACYCLNVMPAKSMEPGCNLFCRDNLQGRTTLCGGLNYMSLYSKAHLDLSRVVDHELFAGDCVTYENVDTNSSMWYWTQCTRSLHPLCEPLSSEGEDSRRLVVNEVANINWTQSVRYCQNQGMILSSISHENVIQYDKETIKIHSPSWTALFRVKIVTYSQTNENTPGVECAFVTVAQNNEPSELEFLPCTADNRMRYICQTGTNPTVTSKTSTTNPDEVTEPSTDSAALSLIVPVIIGSLCGLLILMTIIIIIVCIRKRRNRKNEADETKSIPELESYTLPRRSGIDYKVVEQFMREHNKALADLNRKSRGDIELELTTPTTGSIDSNFRPDGYDNRAADFDDVDDYDHIDSNGQVVDLNHSDQVYNKLGTDDKTGVYDLMYGTRKPPYNEKLMNTYNNLGSVNRNNID